MRITLLFSFSLVLLAACSESIPPEPEQTTRPVKTLLLESPSTGGVRRFPARIDAGHKAELAFRVPGKVHELLVNEGDKVQEGQVLAKLDAKDFQIVVNDRQATFDNARKNFNRAKELIDKGHISRKDYDQLEAELKSSRAALAAARQDLGYTELAAPFSGEIARRHIERFEEIQAKQLVLDLQDLTLLKVKFNVPESLVRGLRIKEDAEPKARELVKVQVAFDNLPGQSFPLTFREAATKADSQTQTFEVTYTMDQLSGIHILPGMTATVTVDLSQVMGGDAVFTVPTAAIVGDYKLDPRAWVVDEQSMTVKSRSVKVRRLTSGDIEVLEGLAPGDRVVVAGAPFLVEDMKVTLLPDREQAAPRQEN